MERYCKMPLGLSRYELLLYYYIATNTNYKDEEYKGKKKFEFNISLRTAEKDLNLTKKLIASTLKKLEEKGYILLVEKGKPPKTPSKYILLFEANFAQKKETIKGTIRETIESKEISDFKQHQETIKETIRVTPSNIYILDNNICSKNERNNTQNSKEVAFNEIWNLYPRKRGKAKAKIKILKLLNKYSVEELKRSVERYSDENKNTQIEFIKYGDTFFNAAYEDYLDCNYEEVSLKSSSYIPQATSFEY